MKGFRMGFPVAQLDCFVAFPGSRTVSEPEVLQLRRLGESLLYVAW